jgi:class 3 adenylate cyclase
MNNPAVTIDNEDILVTKTQERISRAFQRRYQFESNLKPAQHFLLDHVNSKIPLVIMYADLVGSTKMSMTLPVDKMVTIIRGFAYEMSNIIYGCGGYVLKYVGDAIIAFFSSMDNKPHACNQAVECAKLMLTIINKGISPILTQYNYSGIQIKVGIDEGENVIIQHGHDESSLIDILGYCMNRSAKITSLTSPNQIMIGEYVYTDLESHLKKEFNEIVPGPGQWKYINKDTGRIYTLYTTKYKK